MLTRRQILIIVVLIATSVSMIMTMPLYATPDHEDNCLSCHSSGTIAITSTNSTSLHVNASSSFQIHVHAEGSSSDLTMKWPSTINSQFAFVPTSVTDNGPNDEDPAVNKVEFHTHITAPAAQGDYTIQVFAADKGMNGGVYGFNVAVEAEQIPGGMVNTVPTAYFLYSRQAMTIEFEDRSWDPDGAISSRLWNFGDGTTSTESNPTHTFSQLGTYTIVLNVTDNTGNSKTMSQTLTVPSKEERLQLWGFQVVIGSLMIVLTTVCAAGIAHARHRGEKQK